MRLYVIRHGLAETSNPKGDFARQLTDEGRRALKALNFGLAKMGIQFDHIIHSPLIRAVETAHLLESLVRGEMIESKALASPPDDALLAEIRRADGNIAIVSHLPWVSEIVSWLTLGRALDSGAFLFYPGTVAALEGDVEPGKMRLSCLWQPQNFG